MTFPILYLPQPQHSPMCPLIARQFHTMLVLTGVHISGPFEEERELSHVTIECFHAVRPQRRYMW
jgi:hypothetical protein